MLMVDVAPNIKHYQLHQLKEKVKLSRQEVNNSCPNETATESCYEQPRKRRSPAKQRSVTCFKSSMYNNQSLISNHSKESFLNLEHIPPSKRYNRDETTLTDSRDVSSSNHPQLDVLRGTRDDLYPVPPSCKPFSNFVYNSTNPLLSQGYVKMFSAWVLDPDKDIDFSILSDQEKLLLSVQTVEAYLAIISHTNPSNNQIVGKLFSMCSFDEMVDKQRTSTASDFERLPATLYMDAEARLINVYLAVKSFQRSDANKTFKASEIRPVVWCRQTVHNLLAYHLSADEMSLPWHFNQDIIASSNISTPFQWQNYKRSNQKNTCSFLNVYSFLRDRFRSLWQDLTVQHCPKHRGSIETFEISFRFLILSDALLCHDPNFNAVQNGELMKTCLDKLISGYADSRYSTKLHESSISKANQDILDVLCYQSPFEPEFWAYHIITTLPNSIENANAVFDLYRKIPKQLLENKDIQLALAAHRAFRERNISRFFKLIKQASYLLAALLIKYANLMRVAYLEVLSGRCLRQNAVMPFSVFTKQFGFDTEYLGETVSFCNFYKITIDPPPPTDTSVWSIWAPKNVNLSSVDVTSASVNMKKLLCKRFSSRLLKNKWIDCKLARQQILDPTFPTILLQKLQSLQPEKVDYQNEPELLTTPEVEMDSNLKTSDCTIDYDFIKNTPVQDDIKDTFIQSSKHVINSIATSDSNSFSENHVSSSAIHKDEPSLLTEPITYSSQTTEEISVVKPNVSSPKQYPQKVVEPPLKESHSSLINKSPIVKKPSDNLDRISVYSTFDQNSSCSSSIQNETEWVKYFTFRNINKFAKGIEKLKYNLVIASSFYNPNYTKLNSSYVKFHMFCSQFTELLYLLMTQTKLTSTLTDSDSVASASGLSVIGRGLCISDKFDSSIVYVPHATTFYDEELDLTLQVDTNVYFPYNHLFDSTKYLIKQPKPDISYPYIFWLISQPISTASFSPSNNAFWKYEATILYQFINNLTDINKLNPNIAQYMNVLILFCNYSNESFKYESNNLLPLQVHYKMSEAWNDLYNNTHIPWINQLNSHKPSILCCRVGTKTVNGIKLSFSHISQAFSTFSDTVQMTCNYLYESNLPIPPSINIIWKYKLSEPLPLMIISCWKRMLEYSTSKFSKISDAVGLLPQCLDILANSRYMNLSYWNNDQYPTLEEVVKTFYSIKINLTNTIKHYFSLQEDTTFQECIDANDFLLRIRTAIRVCVQSSLLKVQLCEQLYLPYPLWLELSIEENPPWNLLPYPPHWSSQCIKHKDLTHRFSTPLPHNNLSYIDELTNNLFVTPKSNPISRARIRILNILDQEKLNDK